MIFAGFWQEENPLLALERQFLVDADGSVTREDVAAMVDAIVALFHDMYWVDLLYEMLDIAELTTDDLASAIYLFLIGPEDMAYWYKLAFGDAWAFNLVYMGLQSIWDRNYNVTHFILQQVEDIVAEHGYIPDYHVYLDILLGGLTFCYTTPVDDAWRGRGIFRRMMQR